MFGHKNCLLQGIQYVMNILVDEKSCCDFSLKLKKKRRGFRFQVLQLTFFWWRSIFTFYLLHLYRFLKLQFRIKCGGAQDVCGCTSRNVPARYTMCIKHFKKEGNVCTRLKLYKKRREVVSTSQRVKRPQVCTWLLFFL
jgi:hypothetical protein